ncbi:MAG: polyketide cyclase [Bacteroidia bacterium]|nr:polyketide cyclase [Bacteroidia bacterium]
MANNKYKFVTQWTVEGDIHTVSDLLNRPEELPLWWPAVYLEVEKRREGGRDVYYLFTKGWLPYTLRWHFYQTAAELPQRMELQAKGDLEGYGIWTLKQKGKQVEVRYDWEVDANKPILRYLSFLFKPVFAFNHHWAMKKGLESLQLELKRLKSGLSRDEAASPPGATFGFRKYYQQNLARQAQVVST